MNNPTINDTYRVNTYLPNNIRSRTVSLEFIEGMWLGLLDDETVKDWWEISPAEKQRVRELRAKYNK